MNNFGFKRACKKPRLSEGPGFLENLRFKGLESSKQKQRLMELEFKAAAGSAELVSANVNSRLNSSGQSFAIVVVETTY